jgi:glycosyltransferase involved in cell wall biosynthesis
VRIGINTLAVNRADFGGGERYLYFLLRHLAKVDEENEYFVFVNSQNKERFTIENQNFRTIMCPIGVSKVERILYEQCFVHKIINKHKIDIFHCPNNVLPLRIPVKSVVTIQFMINFVFPNYFRPIYRRYYFNILMRSSARRANKIISVSYNLKKEIIKYLEVPVENVVVIPHGVDESFCPLYDKSILLRCTQKLGIEGPYILCIANNVPSKNLGRLILSFDYLKQKYKIPHQLLLVGSLDLLRGEKERLLAILKKTKNLNSRDVIFTNYVNHIDLPPLYSGADVFVLPSFCESFGIPLIEAMKCGTPVVISNVSALPEVVGNAGIKVNPYDTTEIAEGIYTVLKDSNLRQDLVNKGFQRSKEFSWDQIAQRTLCVYEEIHKQGE